MVPTGHLSFESMLLTFGLTVFAWIFFRAENVAHALGFISQMFIGIYYHPGTIFLSTFWSPYLTILIFIVIFMIIEWFGREQQYAIARLGFSWPKPVRWAFYYCILFAIFLFAGTQQQFIYFQF